MPSQRTNSHERQVAVRRPGHSGLLVSGASGINKAPPGVRPRARPRAILKRRPSSKR